MPPARARRRSCAAPPEVVVAGRDRGWWGARRLCAAPGRRRAWRFSSAASMGWRERQRRPAPAADRRRLAAKVAGGEGAGASPPARASCRFSSAASIVGRRLRGTGACSGPVVGTPRWHRVGLCREARGADRAPQIQNLSPTASPTASRTPHSAPAAAGPARSGGRSAVGPREGGRQPVGVEQRAEGGGGGVAPRGVGLGEERGDERLPVGGLRQMSASSAFPASSARSGWRREHNTSTATRWSRACSVGAIAAPTSAGWSAACFASSNDALSARRDALSWWPRPKSTEARTAAAIGGGSAKTRAGWEASRRPSARSRR